MTRLLSYYRAGIRIGFLRDIQYRGAVGLNVLGFLIEPIVYLAVWRTVAASQGGSVGGYTVDALSAYYIVWTLVRVFNLAFTPYGWEWRIRGGRLNEFLSQPIHPFHRDLSFFAGQKFVWVLTWIPVAVILTLTFRPELSPSVFEVAAFLVAIWGGFLVRFLVLYVLGLVTFWTTRGSAIFEIVVAAELVLSGRLVPLDLMPLWTQRVADYLPFKWTFEYPIEVLIGRLEPGEILLGLGAQIAWSAVLGLVLWQVWTRAIRRYAAVGG